jgi:phage tail-like protein
MAAEKFGAKAVGVELDDQLFKLSSDRVARLGLLGRARILHASMFQADLRGATVVTLYQLPQANARLREILERQLRMGARVVSHDFPVPGWQHQKLVTGVLEDGSPHAIYLYWIGRLKGETMPITTDKRGYVAGHYQLELAGLAAGYLDSVEGGDATSDVVMERVGPDQIAHKHIAGVKYEDIALNCGPGMSKDLYDWIKAMIDRNFTRQNGAVVATDYNYKELTRVNFFNALLTEVGFPALDASSKDPAKLSIRFTPESTRHQRGGGTYAGGQKVPFQKRWLSSNFRLQIDKLDCTRVNKIEALTVKQQLVAHSVGASRDYQTEPSHLEISNLAVTLPEANAETFYNWHESFVIKGKNGPEEERSGTLEFLGNDLKEVLFTLELKNLGIFRLTPEKVEAGSENIRRVKAEMYCQEVAFGYMSGVTETAAAKLAAISPLVQAPSGQTTSIAPAQQAPHVWPSLRFRT